MLTDEDLAIIRDRLNENPINRVFPYPITDYRCDALTLLAEVERLRQQEAAMREIVEAVANIKEWLPLDNPSQPYDAQISLLTITKARAVLAEKES